MMKRRILFLLIGLAMLAAAQSTPDRRVFILLGPPGAGKTTQSKVLAKRYKLPVINAATLLKQSGGGKGGLNKQLKVQVEGGDLLGDKGLNELFQARIRRGDCYKGFILDGYPGNKVQAEFMSAQLKDLAFPPPTIVHLQVTDDVAKQRMQRRGRADDKVRDPEQRLAEFRAQEKSVLEYFPDSQVIHVDGSPGEREVSSDIEKKLAARK